MDKNIKCNPFHDTLFDIAEETEQEKELHSHGLLYIDNFDAKTKFEAIGLFEDIKWKGIKYYLLNISGYKCVIDLFANRNTITKDLKGLGLLTPTLEREFDELLTVVFRCYRVGI